MGDLADTAFAGDTLARFVARTRWDDLPAAIRHEAKRALLNFTGCALGTSSDPAVATAVRVLAPFSGGSSATVIGRGERMDVMCTAFVNTISSNMLDFDDTHLSTVIHPTAPVASPALALAEHRKLSGTDLLLAYALGAEVECRIGLAVSPGHYARGWHITATCGVFGSAAATTKLLKLTPAQTWHALGLAASQSAGLVENLATSAKNVGVGNASRNGLFAALLAEQDWTSAPAAIEGRFGWARAAGDAPGLGAMTGALGERWELATNSYKPYPCGIVLHSVIDACLELRARHGLSAADVESAVVRGDALLLDRGDRAVDNERDAKISIHHSVAAPFLWGAAGVREFSTVCVQDPAAVAMRGRVRVEVDPRLPPGAAHVRVRTTGGAEHETTVLHARGSLQKPLSDADLETKARTHAATVAPRVDLDKAIDLIWNLERVEDVGVLTACLAAREN